MKNKKERPQMEVKLTWKGKLWYWSHKLLCFRECKMPGKWTYLTEQKPKFKA